MAQLPQTRVSLLLRLRQRDDSKAWSEFLAVYGPAVYGYYRRRGLQEADAGDLTQNVFRLVAAHIARFDYDQQRGRFRSWLFTIVSRELIKFQQRSAMKAELVPDFDSVVDERGEPLWDQSVHRGLFDAALAQVRTQVADATFQAFELTAVDGLSGEEAAARLGMSRAAVYLARGRVLARLREIIATLESSEAD